MYSLKTRSYGGICTESCRYRPLKFYCARLQRIQYLEVMRRLAEEGLGATAVLIHLIRASLIFSIGANCVKTGFTFHTDGANDQVRG